MLTLPYKCWACGRQTRDLYDVICFYKFGIGRPLDVANYSIIEWRGQSDISGSNPKKRQRYLFSICGDCAKTLYRRECVRCPFNWRKGDPTSFKWESPFIIIVEMGGYYKTEYKTQYKKIYKHHPMEPLLGYNQKDVVRDEGIAWVVKEEVPVRVYVPPIKIPIYVCFGYGWTLHKMGYL